MEIYKKMYYSLFNTVTDALNELQEGNWSRAMEKLKMGQIGSEKLYIEANEKLEEENGGGSFSAGR